MTEELNPDRQLSRTELAANYGQWLANRQQQIFGAVLTAEKLPHPQFEVDLPGGGFINPSFLRAEAYPYAFINGFNQIYVRPGVAATTLNQFLNEPVPLYPFMAWPDRLEQHPLAQATGPRRIVDTLMTAHEFGHSYYQKTVGDYLPHQRVTNLLFTPFGEYLQEGVGILFQRVAGEVMKLHPAQFNLNGNDLEVIDQHFAARQLLNEQSPMGPYHVGYAFIENVFQTGVDAKTEPKITLEKLASGLVAITAFLGKVDPLSANRRGNMSGAIDRALLGPGAKLKEFETNQQRKKQAEKILAVIGR